MEKIKNNSTEQPQEDGFSELHRLEDEFNDKNEIGSRREILLKMGNRIREMVGELDENLSKEVHQLSPEEIRNFDEDLMQDPDEFVAYLRFGTVDKDGIDRYLEPTKHFTPLVSPRFYDKGLHYFNSSGFETKNLDTFFENYTDSKQAIDSLPEGFVADNIHLISKYDDIQQIFSGFSPDLKRRIFTDYWREHHYPSPDNQNEAISRYPIDEFISLGLKLDKEEIPSFMSARDILDNHELLSERGFDFSLDEIAHIKKAEDEKAKQREQQILREKLENSPNSLTIDEVLDNYDYLKSKGFSITVEELFEQERKVEKQRRESIPSGFIGRREADDVAPGWWDRRI